MAVSDEQIRGHGRHDQALTCEDHVGHFGRLERPAPGISNRPHAWTDRSSSESDRP